MFAQDTASSRVDNEFAESYVEKVRHLLTDDEICAKFIDAAVEEYMGRVTTDETRISSYSPVVLSLIQKEAVMRGFRRSIDYFHVLPTPTMLASCLHLRTKLENEIGAISNSFDQFEERGLLFGHIMGLGKSYIIIGIIACIIKLEDMFQRSSCKILIVASKGPIGVLKGELQDVCSNSLSPVFLDDERNTAAKKSEIIQWKKDYSKGRQLMLVSIEDLVTCKDELQLLTNYLTAVFLDEAQDLRIGSSNFLNYDQKPKHQLFDLLRRGSAPGCPRSVGTSVMLSTGTPITNSAVDLISLLGLFASNCLGVCRADMEKVVRCLCKLLDAFGGDDEDEDDDLSFLQELREWLHTTMMSRVSRNDSLLPRFDFIVEVTLHEDIRKTYAQQGIIDCKKLVNWSTKIVCDVDRLALLRKNSLFELGYQQGMVSVDDSSPTLNTSSSTMDQSFSEGHTSRSSFGSSSSSLFSPSPPSSDPTNESSSMELSMSGLDLSLLSEQRYSTNTEVGTADMSVASTQDHKKGGTFLSARSVCKDMAMGIDNLLSNNYPLTRHKIRTVVAILQAAVKVGVKILAIARSIDVLKLINHELDALDMLYYYMDGSSGDMERKQWVEDFQKNTDPDRKIFLGSMVMSTGWTMTEATSMIIIETSDNPTEDEQSLARAWRGKQTQQVLTWRILMRETIEVSVYNTALRKSKINSILLDEDSPYTVQDCVDAADKKDGMRHTTNAFPVQNIQDVVAVTTSSIAFTPNGKILYDAVALALAELTDITSNILLVNKK